MFNESVSWYALPSPSPDNFDHLIPKDEASEPDVIQDEEEDIGTLEESPISF